jgi:hypothetical protein
MGVHARAGAMGEDAVTLSNDFLLHPNPISTPLDQKSKYLRE